MSDRSPVVPHFQEELSAYVSAELDEQDRKHVEEHLAVCHDCMEQLRRLQKLDALLSEPDEMEPRRDFLKQVLTRVEKERKVLALRARRSIAVFLAAAVLAFFALLLSLQKQTPPLPPPVVKKPPIHTQQPPQQTPVILSPAPVESPTEDPELIANLEELQNMELIRDFENLDNLDLAMMMTATEEAK